MVLAFQMLQKMQHFSQATSFEGQNGLYESRDVAFLFIAY